MSKPREFHVMEFRWNDGEITYTTVKKDHPDQFLVREVLPNDEITQLHAALQVAQKFLEETHCWFYYKDVGDVVEKKHREDCRKCLTKAALTNILEGK